MTVASNKAMGQTRCHPSHTDDSIGSTTSLASSEDTIVENNLNIATDWKRCPLTAY